MIREDAAVSFDLVTGATGFIGRYVCARLLEKGRSVRIICRAGSENKLPDELRNRVVVTHVDLERLARGDQASQAALAQAMRNVSRVFHCAGHVSDWGPEELFHAMNVDATRVLLEESARAGVCRFVHLSSIAAFGTPSPSYFDDNSPLGNGRDAYSRTKALGEKVVFEFHAKKGLPVTVIRPAVVYGLEGTWLEEPLEMLEKGKMFLLGGGRGTCHPCYIENLVDAMLLASEHRRAIGQGYIVADDDPISFAEYFNAIAEIAGRAPIRRSIPLPFARVMAAGFELSARAIRAGGRPLLTQAALDMVTTTSRMSMKKIRDDLGFQPRWSFRSAMEELRARHRARQGGFKAYIFDCDGTIADTMPLHYEAWLEALSRWKCKFPQKLFYAWAGRPGDRIVELLNERYGLSMPPQEVFREKERCYVELLPRVRALMSVRDSIEKKHGKIPLAVVSGSPRESVLKTLRALGLEDRFETVLGCEDYARGKPDPEPFLAAAARLKVDPRDCLVFEDADLGIEAARAAGMSWVRVGSPN